jgi:peroxiredoxin
MKVEIHNQLMGDCPSNSLEEQMVGRYARILSLFSVALIFVSLHSLILPKESHADGHLWGKLGIVRIDEKLTAPSFRLKDLNGKEVKLEDHRGKIVFLNFWATWCPPCRDEMPSMEKLYTEFKDRDFTILAVDLQEGTRKVRAFKEKFKLNFPILLDSDGRVGSRYVVRSIPTTYLIDREGYIIGAAWGARDWASKEAFELIDHLLIAAEKKPAPVVEPEVEEEEEVIVLTEEETEQVKKSSIWLIISLGAIVLALLVSFVFIPKRFQKIEKRLERRDKKINRLKIKLGKINSKLEKAESERKKKRLLKRKERLLKKIKKWEELQIS